MSTRSQLPITDAESSCGCGCGCGDSAATSAETAATTGAAGVSTEILVDGMTCGHCVKAVTEELETIDGVSGVSIDLNAGGTSRVTVTSSAPVDEAAIAEAVDEAGYELHR